MSIDRMTYTGSEYPAQGAAFNDLTREAPPAHKNTMAEQLMTIQQQLLDMRRRQEEFAAQIAKQLDIIEKKLG